MTAKDIAISVEGLSKRYLVGHQSARTERYQTLRESLLRSMKTFGRQAFNMARGQAVQGDEIEEFWALKDISFQVRRGEVIGIVGRNGAGKSTLLKILSRITEPTEGRVRIRGRVASLLEVGTGFHPELTGRENIFLNGAILGMTRREIRARFDEIVDFADVEQFLDTPVKRYSSGMYMRLAFAVAAHLEPEILVVDEVLAVGDAEFQRKCLGKMSEVASGGRTVLFVSHQMAAIQNLCEKTMVLSEGHLRCFSPTEEAVAVYLRQQTAADRDFSRLRPSWAKPCIDRVTILDRHGVPRNRFSLDESVMIEIAFASSRDPIRKPVMGIVINHATRGTIGGVNTRMTGFNTEAGRYSSGKFLCRLDDMPLLQGQYTLDIWLGDGPTDIDTIPAAATLTVEEGDVYKSGATPFHHLGVIFLKPSWKFEGVTERANAQPH